MLLQTFLDSLKLDHAAITTVAEIVRAFMSTLQPHERNSFPRKQIVKTIQSRFPVVTFRNQQCVPGVVCPKCETPVQV